MIVFDLACACGFLFEGWFSDYDEFTRQEREGRISCPSCGGREGLRKVLSPIRYQKNKSCAAVEHEPSCHQETPSIRPPQSLDQAMRALREFVEKNFDDVGSNFAVQTLKIHYGVEESKNIRGVMTADEEKMLDREGIPYLKIPNPGKKENN